MNIYRRFLVDFQWKYSSSSSISRSLSSNILLATQIQSTFQWQSLHSSSSSFTFDWIEMNSFNLVLFHQCNNKSSKVRKIDKRNISEVIVQLFLTGIFPEERRKRSKVMEMIESKRTYVTALVPSETACLANSPGNKRRTAVWISRDDIVWRLLYWANRDASLAIRSTSNRWWNSLTTVIPTEYIVDKAVHNRHGFTRNTRIGMNLFESLNSPIGIPMDAYLFEYFVNVDWIGFFTWEKYLENFQSDWQGDTYVFVCCLSSRHSHQFY